ncbi:MAG TPA: ATP-binding protein [Acidimicrobiales bacterium]|nr:ATP-binding protein [Acidimicrobiales bacterium]
MRWFRRVRALGSAIARRFRRLSLRARLSLGLVLVVGVGLVVADIVVYSQVESYLLSQVDSELNTALQPVVRQLTSGGGFFSGNFGFGRDTPPGTCGALIDSSGVVTETPSTSLEGRPAPDFPASLRTPSSSGTASYFSVGANGDSSFRYRVLAQPETLLIFGSETPGYAVVAIPLTSLDQTLSQLVTIDVAVSAAVLVVLALLGLVVIRVGMRPLVAIERTAGAIAAGDLSRRVEPADTHTEVGRLGTSLNKMLAQIEQAFAEQQASEARLRQFLADASHELRTPLTSIRGYSELFRRGAADHPEDLTSAMRRIEDEAARMGVLVDDLLLLARLDQGRPLERAPVDLAEIAREVSADASVVDAERPITLEASAPIIVIGDEQRLRQALANLVRNALEHTPPGTPVEVSVRVEADRAVLTVADHGPGIPPEHLPRIFERFYRADPARTRESGGMGLGLAIVLSIAEAHGGSARVESEMGSGATFLVELPLATQAAGGVDSGRPSTGPGQVAG